MSRRLALTIAALAVLLPGCGAGSAPLPSSSASRDALASALDAWKGGKTPAALADTSPKVEMVDSEWNSGAVLSDFAIGEESAGEGTRTISASLTLRGKAAKDVKYMALGTDPIRIFRDDDFQRAMNMENNPAPKKPR